MKWKDKTNNMSKKNNFAFFGSSRFSVIVLDELKKLGLIPSLIVTSPDKPQGRKMEIMPNVVKVWANDNSIKCFDPAKLNAEFAAEISKLVSDIFVVASYGKIIPRSVIDLPVHGSLNIHPSLLPLYRGPSPLPSAMLDDAKQTGITIMKMDEHMDHGPIVAQENVQIDEWPIYEEFEEKMAREGARVLAKALPKWIKGQIKPVNQDHASATYTKKISKEDAFIDLRDDPYANFRKVQAFHFWPKAYFVIVHNANKLRVKITSASFKNNEFIIEKVIPEGGREMSFQDFKRGYLVF